MSVVCRLSLLLRYAEFITCNNCSKRISADALQREPGDVDRGGPIGQFVADDAPGYGMHQGILMGDQGTMIPRPQCHNYRNFMEMVGPVGLEPTTKGL